MTPEEIGERLAAAVGVGEHSVSAGGRHARACLEVPAESWVRAAEVARDEVDLGYFDWLAGVDEDERGFGVVVHLWSLVGRYGTLLRTTVPRNAPTLTTLTSVFPGAAWPERETAEMFGIQFAGHRNPGKLLLPDEFEGHPLRKDFVLAARVAKAWPGAKEPGEGEGSAPGRRRTRPPGVPDPNEWGPEAGRLPPEPAGRERPASPASPARAARSERPARPERPPRDRDA